MSYIKISLEKYERLPDKSGKYLTTNSDKTKCYYKDEKLHRKRKPAKINKYGYKVYYLNGKIHRSKGPAMTGPDGYEEYFKNGKRHRVDGPSTTGLTGTKFFYLKGKRYSRERFIKRLTKSQLKKFILNPDNF